EAILRLAAGGSRRDPRRRSAHGARRCGSGSVARAGRGGADPRQARGRGARSAGGGGRGPGREAAPAQRVQGAAVAGRRPARPACGGRLVVSEHEQLCTYLRAKVSGASHNDRRALFALREEATTVYWCLLTMSPAGDIV